MLQIRLLIPMLRWMSLWLNREAKQIPGDGM